MGFFKDLRQASNFEKEFLAKKASITNLSKISPETVALENFAIKYDRDRYIKKLNSSSSKTELEQEMAYTFEGLAIFYDKVLKDGVDIWLNKKYATEQWERFFVLRTGYVLQGDMHRALRCYGIQIGIICMIEGILYYDLTVFPLAVNPIVIDLKNKYDALEKERGVEIAKRVSKDYE